MFIVVRVLNSEFQSNLCAIPKSLNITCRLWFYENFTKFGHLKTNNILNYVQSFLDS